MNTPADLRAANSSSRVDQDGNGVGVPRRHPERQIDRRDGVLKCGAIVDYPAECVLDPTEVARACVIEHSQRNQVDAWSNTLVVARRPADDAGYVGAVRTGRTVVVGIGVVLAREVPAADDFVVRSESTTEGEVVIRDTAIDYGYSLADPCEAIVRDD